MAHESSKRRIQIFPRPALLEMILGEAIYKGLTNDRGIANKVRVVDDIIESHYYAHMHERDRDVFRELGRQYKKEKGLNF